MRLWWPCAFALAIGCGDADVSDGHRTQTPDVGVPVEGTTTPSTPPTPSTPVIDDTTAVAWIERECRGCHAKRKDGELNANFSMPDVLTKQWLETTDRTTTAYELLVKKRIGAEDGTYPSAMPLGAMG